MKSPALFLLILCLLLVGAVQATVINGTVLLTTDYNAELKMSSSDLATTKEYSYSVPSNNALVVTSMSYYSEGTTYNFRFSRPSSNDITGSVTLTSTGLFTGEEKLSINGGTSSTISYYKVPFYPAFPGTTWYYVTTGDQYYFVLTDSSRFNYAVSGDIFHPVYAPFKLDTDADAYISADGNPDIKPINQVTVTPLSSGSFTAVNYYESIPALKEAIKYTNSTQEAYASSGFDLSFFKKLIDVLYSSYKAIQDFFNQITTLSTWVMAIAFFLFAGKVFVGFVVLHLLLNIVWVMSKHMKSGDDLFLAALKIVDNEKKLLMFFKDLFMFVKDLIKWW